MDFEGSGSGDSSEKVSWAIVLLEAVGQWSPVSLLILAQLLIVAVLASIAAALWRVQLRLAEDGLRGAVGT